MKPGDILLVAPADSGSEKIVKTDATFSSEGGSPASHTLQFIAEVKGKRLYLDGQFSEDFLGFAFGSADPLVGNIQVIDEDEVKRRYSHRGLLIAQLKMPLNEEQSARLKNEAIRLQRDFKFGVVGKRDLVCTEVNDQALNAAAGIDIRKRPADAVSSLDRLWQRTAHYAVDATPADVYHDKQNFKILGVKWAERPPKTAKKEETK
jgi:hypothetical protein